MSDSHENWTNLEAAVEVANEFECEYLLHAGDLISPQRVDILESFKGQVIFVWGNNESEKMGLTRKMDAAANIELAGGFYEGELGGVRIFMNHYPKYAEHAAQTDLYDLVIHGHTHVYREEHFGNTLLLNPGEIQGNDGPASFVIYDTEGKTWEQITIE